MQVSPRAVALATALSVVAAGLVMMFEPGAFPGEAGDTRLNMYMLEHGYRWLAGLDSSFWNAPVFHPAPLAFAYSENHAGTMPWYASLRAVGLAREPAFAAWMGSMFVANFACAYVVLARLGAGTLGACAGAFVFSFGLPVMMQTGHPQLVPRMFVPLAFLALARLRESGRLPAFAALVASLVAQCYVGMYTGWFLALSVAAAIVAGAVFERGAFLRAIAGDSARACLARVAIAGAGVVALLPLLLPYLEVYRIGVVARGDAATQLALLLPQPAAYFHTTGSALLWGALDAVGAGMPMAHEKRLFVGALPLLALAAVPWALARGRLPDAARPILVLAAISYVLLALLVVRIGDFSLYESLAALPGVGAFRAVGRYLLVALFPLAIVVALTWRAALERLAPARRTILGCVLLAAVVVDQWAWHVPQMTFAESSRRVAAVRAAVEPVLGGDQAFYLSVAGDPEPHVRHVDAMLAAAELGIATVNGYAASTPPGYPFELWAGTRLPCARLAGWLVRSGAAASPARALEDVTVVGGVRCDGPEAPSVTLARGPIAKEDLAFDASISPATVDCAGPVSLDLSLTNRGGVRWPAESASEGHRYQVRYAWRVLALDGIPAGGYDSRAALPHDLEPSGQLSVAIEVVPPAGAESFGVQVNVVQEYVHWARDEAATEPTLRVACARR